MNEQKLINAIKDLTQEVISLKKKVGDLNETNKVLTADIETLSNKISNL